MGTNSFIVIFTNCEIKGLTTPLLLDTAMHIFSDVNYLPSTNTQKSSRSGRQYSEKVKQTSETVS